MPTGIYQRKSFTEKHKKNMSERLFGNKYALGAKRTKKFKQNLSQKFTGEGHPSWKGDKAKYPAIHSWVRRHFKFQLQCENPKCIYPKICSHGGIVKKPKLLECANVSKKYKRDIKDWIKLCPSCHRKWDMGIIKLSIRDILNKRK